jgi:hypothetical protein
MYIPYTTFRAVPILASNSASRRHSDSARRWLSDSARFEIFFIYRQSGRLPDSASRRYVFRLRISPRIRSQNRNGSMCIVRDICQTYLCKNPRKSASLPCPFKGTQTWNTLFCRNWNPMVSKACNTRFLKIIFDSLEIFDFLTFPCKLSQRWNMFRRLSGSDRRCCVWLIHT